MIQNPWWRDAESIQSDMHIMEYTGSSAKWNPRIRHFFDMNTDSVYTLRGPRQVGKSTLMKLIIRDLLMEGIDPRNIFYWTCDLVEGPKSLVELIESFLDLIGRRREGRRYIFLDEISAVKEWQRGVKHLYDTGRLVNTTMILTGSHSLDIRRAAERLPGRRGKVSGPVDKVLLPMKFAEYIETRDKEMAELFSSLDLLRFETRMKIIEEVSRGLIPPIVREVELYSKELSRYFEEYLLTGGIPKALDDYQKYGEIRQETYSFYVRVTIGDILRWNKREIYLTQIVRRIIETLSSRVSWRSLKRDTDIGHVNTVAEYVDVLRSSFVLCPLYAFDPNRKEPIYGKEKKVHFLDPFIFHALRGWVNQAPSYQGALNYLSGEGKPKLIECVVCDHLIRFVYNLMPIDDFEPTRNVMYWRSKRNEVDFIIKMGEEYLPLEVKYSSSFSRRDINGVYALTRKNSPYKGIIITRDLLDNEKGVVAIPAFLFLILI